MRRILLSMLLLFSSTLLLSAQNVLLDSEDFEGSVDWTVANNCTGYNWQLVTGGTGGGAQCAGFPSGLASAGCGASLMTTTYSVRNPGLQDSIYVYFDFYHSTTAPSSADYLSLSLIDSDGVNVISPTPGNVPRYTGSAGWVPYIFKVAAQDIIAGPGETYFKVAFTAIGDAGDNMFIDGIKIYHVKHAPIMLVLSPNGGETLEAGTANTIEWWAPEVTKVKLSYSLNGGSTWTGIDSNIAGSAGTYNWNVPGTLSSTNARIRVTDMSNSSYGDISDANFTIEIPVKVKLLTPNGGGTINGGSVYNVTWSSTNVNKVNLEYTVNGGANWISMASNVTASLGTYAWTVPATATSNARVRVSNAADAALFDESDAAFAISVVPFIQVLTPNTATTLNSGSSYNITWTSANVNNVNLELTVNGGTNWSSIASNVAASTGSYSWTVPSTATTNARIRITDASDASVFDQSDAAFIISTVPTVKLLTPNGGNTLGTGSSFDITWTSANVNNVNLELSTNGGSSWSSIANNISASLGSYSWTVPSSPTTNALVRISDAADAAVKDQSDAVFSITVTPFVQLLTPNGGENLAAGSSFNITWTAGNVSNVNLEFSSNGGSSWSTIASNQNAATGTYSWTVPSSATTNGRVRVSDASSAGTNDQSDASFEIAISPFVQLVTPNGGNTIGAGSTYNITWTSASVNNVKLEYSSNGGTSWSSIVNSVAAASGTYAWTVPSNATTTARVRVSDASNAAVNDASDADFAITTAAFVDLLTPNGGNTLGAGSVYNITWTSSGVTNVNLEYSSNGGTSWSSIASNIAAASGTYAWTVPSSATNTGKVRVSDASDATVNDASDANFSISTAKFIELLTPNGGNTLQTGTSFNITWTSASITNVNLEYSSDGGTNWSSIATNVAASAGTYSWTVPAGNTSTARVRVSDAADATVTDMSNANFSIEDNTGIADTKAASLKLYPNPSQGIVTVEYEIAAGAPVAITIRDIAGSVVFTQQADASGLINVDLRSVNAAGGMYFLELNDGNSSVRKEFMLY